MAFTTIPLRPLAAPHLLALPPRELPSKSLGGASYYLKTGVEFKDAGRTTGIGASLLADIRARTTQQPNPTAQSITTDTTLSPQNLGDTDPLDLGYHYPILDYALGGVTVSNCKLNVASGTIIATYGSIAGAAGLTIGAGGQFLPIGTPILPVWIVEYNTVQEGNTAYWLKTWSGSVPSGVSGQASDPVVACRFTQWSMLGTDDDQFRAAYGARQLNFQDCEFHGGKLSTVAPTLNFTN